MARPNTTLSIVAFTPGGVDKLGELSGLTWDSAGAPDGAIACQVQVSNSGGTVLSNVINGSVASVLATAPSKPDPLSFTVTDANANPAGGGLNLNVVLQTPDGGAAIDQAEYRVDGGAGQSMGLLGIGVFSVLGLPNDVSASLAYRLHNSVDWGPWSDAKSDTPTDNNKPSGTFFINATTGQIDIIGATEPGTCFLMVSSDPSVLAGAVIEAGTGALVVASFAFGVGDTSGSIDITGLAEAGYTLHGTLKDPSANYSDDPALPFTVVDSTSPATFIGTADATGWATQHTFPLALPSSGRVTVVVASNVSKAVSAVTIGGHSATIRAAFETVSEYIYLADVIVDGTNNDVVIDVANTNKIRVAAWDMKARAFVSVAQSTVNNATADLILDTTTLAGDALVGGYASSKALAPTLTGLIFDVPEAVLNGKYSAMFSNLNATGGAPEPFQAATATTFYDSEAALGLYR